MKLPTAEELEFSNVLPLLIGTVFLIILVIVINKVLKNIVFQSAYLEILRSFAKEYGYKKPVSKWVFVFIEIAGICLALFFISSFFKNAFLTAGILFVLVLLSVFLAVKFYTPPFKAFALAEKLTYDSDAVYGKYKDMNIFIKMEKKTIDYNPESFSRRDENVNFVKRIISVSLSPENEKIKNTKFINGIRTIDPKVFTPDFSSAEKMLSDIPASDNTRVYISEINEKEFLTIEKRNSSFLFIAELYYLCEAAEKIIEVLNSKDQDNISSMQQSPEVSKT